MTFILIHINVLVRCLHDQSVEEERVTETALYIKKGISSSTLKLIAMAAMLADHVGAVILEPMLLQKGYDPGIYEADMFLRLVIGRMAFPIFCFLLVEGFRRTANVYSYGGRLFLFAMLSEAAFDLAVSGVWFEWTNQNVMFTLLIGLAVMELSRRIETWSDKFYLTAIAKLAVLAAGMIIAEFLRTDYGSFGVLCIAVLFHTRRDRWMQMMAGAVAFVVGDYLLNGSTAELMAPLGFLAVAAYNGRKGMRLKYLFYAFYPVHLLVLSGIRQLLV